MIDSTENVIFIAKGIDVPGKHVAGVCAIRWILRGCRSRSGSIVRLRAQKIGGRWATSTQAVDEFLTALSATSLSEPSTPRSPSRRRTASENAERELDAAWHLNH